LAYIKNADTIRQRIIEKNGLAKNAEVGVFSSFGKGQTVDMGAREIFVIATTNDIDLEKEVVVPEGANVAPFMRLRNIFVDHEYEFKYCVGKLRNAPSPFFGPDGLMKGWKCRLYISDLPNNPYPNDILTLAQDGGICVSVGFGATDAGKPTLAEVKRYSQDGVTPKSIVRAWDWYELSATMFPMNLAAQQVGLATTGDTVKSYKQDQLLDYRLGVFDNLLCKGKVSRATAEAFGFPLNEKDAPKEKSVPVRKRRICIM
jgi:hypothetical protein